MSVVMNRQNFVGSEVTPVPRYKSQFSSSSIPGHVLEPVQSEKTKTLKNCCRIFVELMFTQVGVGCLLISYTILGAIAFQYLETLEPIDFISEVEQARSRTVSDLWNITNTYNTLNKRLWRQTTQHIIRSYQEDIITNIKAGYDSRTVEERWTFPSALMFTLSVITAIGYGNLVPSTKWGKIVTMLYAVFGIPVYVLYFLNMGKVLANLFKWLYRKIYYCATRRSRQTRYEVMENTGDLEENLTLGRQEEEVLIPSTACVWVMLFYLSLGTVMFAEWEQWNYLDSLYFCVTSLFKIGLGDFVPGTGTQMEKDADVDELQANQMKLYVSFLYLLVGLGVVSMNCYLLREEVLMRMSQVRKKMTELRAKIKFSLRKNLR